MNVHHLHSVSIFIHLLAPLVLVPSPAAASGTSLRFADVTRAWGLPPVWWRRLKYGGAIVADLDGDGYLDIVLSHHNNCCLTIHFNNGPAKSFSTSSQTEFRDIHGVNVVRTSPFQKHTQVTASVGGSFGTVRNAALLIDISSSSSLSPLQRSSSAFQRTVKKMGTFPQKTGGRGRTVLFVRLRSRKQRFYLDAIVFNSPMIKPPSKRPNDHVFVTGARRGRFYARKRATVPKDFRRDPNGYGYVTDIDNDNTMEIITFSNFRMYKITNPYTLTDVTKRVLQTSQDTFTDNNARGELLAVAAVAELDVDNDGHWDLYLARSVQGDLGWVGRVMRVKTVRDVLLRNDKGRKYNIIPQSDMLTNSRGVTAGDFDNDGYTDVYVSLYDKAYDAVLFNNRQGGFHKPVRFARRCGNKVPGDMATAADFDRDGYVDLLVSCGDWHNKARGGAFKMFRNQGGKGCGSSVSVRVGDSPSRRTTNLHATVKAKVRGIKGIIMRRVGSPGSAAGNSVLDTVTLGTGSANKVEWILIEWVTGERKWRVNVKAMSSIFVGARAGKRTTTKVKRRK